MATGVIRQSNRRSENLFFSGMAVLILGTVFWGSRAPIFWPGYSELRCPT